jgi:hypothetical protein
MSHGMSSAYLYTVRGLGCRVTARRGVSAGSRCSEDAMWAHVNAACNRLRTNAHRLRMLLATAVLYQPTFRAGQGALNQERAFISPACGVHLTRVRRTSHSRAAYISLACGVHLTNVWHTSHSRAAHISLACGTHLTRVRHTSHSRVPRRCSAAQACSGCLCAHGSVTCCRRGNGAAESP